jgi:hypothetical protein
VVGQNGLLFSRCLSSGTGPLPDQVAFKLRDSGKEGHHDSSGVRGRIRLWLRLRLELLRRWKRFNKLVEIAGGARQVISEKQASSSTLNLYFNANAQKSAQNNSPNHIYF